MQNLETVDLDDSEISNSYEINQAVVAKVTNVDEEKERMAFSLKMRDVYSGEASSSVDRLMSYITASEKIYDHFGSLDGKLVSKSILCV